MACERTNTIQPLILKAWQDQGGPSMVTRASVLPGGTFRFPNTCSLEFPKEIELVFNHPCGLLFAVRIEVVNSPGRRTHHPRPYGRQAGRQDQGCGHSNQARWETSWETRERQDQGGGHSIPAKAATLKTALRTPTVNCLGKKMVYSHRWRVQDLIFACD